MRKFFKKTDPFKYVILFILFGLIFVRLFNVFVYPSFEILSAIIILGVCMVGLVLIWIDEVMGRESLEQANRTIQEKQAALIRSERLAALGRLAGGIAHELNNPLTGIVGNAELILKRGYKKDTGCDDCFHKMETIEKEGRRCQDIAKNLLQFSRKRKAVMKEIFVNDVLEDAFKILEHHLSRPGAQIKIVKNLADDLPAIMADHDQLEQVVINLLINSRDAMPEGGTITVATGKSEGKVFVDISDNGAGIPEELRSKIFEPLFTTKEEGKGTGLGLSISRDIIAQHGGTLHFKSKVGEGTTFSISLPQRT